MSVSLIWARDNTEIGARVLLSGIQMKSDFLTFGGHIHKTEIFHVRTTMKYSTCSKLPLAAQNFIKSWWLWWIVASPALLCQLLLWCKWDKPPSPNSSNKQPSSCQNEQILDYSQRIGSQFIIRKRSSTKVDRGGAVCGQETDKVLNAEWIFHRRQYWHLLDSV